MKNIFVFVTLSLSQLVSAQWFTAAPLSTRRQEMPSVLLDGKIYTIGGIDNTGQTVATTEIYNPAANSWSIGEPMPTTRHHHAMCVLDRKIYVMGGYDNILFTPQTSVFMFDPDSAKWILMFEIGRAHV